MKNLDKDFGIPGRLLSLTTSLEMVLQPVDGIGEQRAIFLA
jgi:hypothetical protein